jgi:hypothetical protein
MENVVTNFVTVVETYYCRVDGINIVSAKKMFVW